MTTRTFEDTPATRARVPLLLGLVGPSSSGKTKSALRLADGIRRVTGGETFCIDTESRRALHYADEHQFRHLEFTAPFGSLDYLRAITHCVKKGAGVVIVDSMSHEHEGPGGLIDLQEQELTRLAGDEFAKRQKMTMLAWQKPKAARRALITGLLQLNANFIFCFRAREKSKPITKAGGKTEIVQMGFMPIAGEEFLFEMTANCLLLPKSGGVPTWQSDHIGELAVMKMPSYLAHIFQEGKPLDEAAGERLAIWAGGTATASMTTKAETPQTEAPPAGRPSEDDLQQAYLQLIADTIQEATDPAQLTAWWNSQKDQRKRYKIPPSELAAWREKLMVKVQDLKRPGRAPADLTSPPVGTLFPGGRT